MLSRLAVESVRRRCRCGTSCLVIALACTLAACTMMPPENERMRIERIESAVLPMARAALDAGQAQTARRLYTRLLEVDPESADARMGLGDVHAANREMRQAATWYLAAVEHARTPPERHAALLAHGRAALAAGDLEAARSSFARLADPAENAAPAVAAWGFNGIGVLHLLAGSPREAVAAFETAALRDPGERKIQNNLERAVKIAAAHPGASSEAIEPLAADIVASADVAGVLEMATPDAPPVREPQAEDAAPIAPPATAGDPAGEETHQQRAPDTNAPPAAPGENLADIANLANVSEPADAPPAAPGADPSDLADVSETVDSPPETEREPGTGDAAPIAPAAPGADGDDAGPLPKGFIVEADGDPYVQVGAYAVEAHAESMAARMRGQTGLPVRLWTPEADGQTLFKVIVGPVTAKTPADDLVSLLGADRAARADFALDGGDRPDAAPAID